MVTFAPLFEYIIECQEDFVQNLLSSAVMKFVSELYVTVTVTITITVTITVTTVTVTTVID